MTNFEKIKSMSLDEIAYTMSPAITDYHQTDDYVVFTDKLLSIDGENINEKRN